MLTFKVAKGRVHALEAPDEDPRGGVVSGEIYFAYGSNLSPTQMRARCPSARLMGTGCLNGYRLGFTRRSVKWGGGVADLLPEPGAHVWGALYELSAEEFERLDFYEGVPAAYKRELVELVDMSGVRWSAWAYFVVQKSPHVTPTHAYMRTILDGAREVDLPADYLEFLQGVPSAPP